MHCSSLHLSVNICSLLSGNCLINVLKGFWVIINSLDLDVDVPPNPAKMTLISQIRNHFSVMFKKKKHMMDFRDVTNLMRGLDRCGTRWQRREGPLTGSPPPPPGSPPVPPAICEADT